jgi:hypothetical protein
MFGVLSLALAKPALSKAVFPLDRFKTNKPSFSIARTVLTSRVISSTLKRKAASPSETLLGRHNANGMMCRKQ